MNLSDRINAAYLTHTGSTKARGARAWFARTLKVTPRTVTRWCNGTQPFEGPALASLEMLEKMATLIRGYVRVNWFALADSLRITQGP